MEQLRLFYSTTSPYARKTRVFWREKGFENVVELECNPFNDPPELLQYGTLAKVPTLVTSDRVVYDSRTICEYLDSLGGKRICALEGPQRWDTLMAHALTDRLFEYSIGLVLENRRPANEQSPSTMARQEVQIHRALRAMEEFVPQLSTVGGAFCFAHICFAVALGYMDFRYRRLNWRALFPTLRHWYGAHEHRPSLVQTQPSDHSNTALDRG